MPQITTGTFADGPNKGRKWQSYQDPSSPTGWTRKSWNPYDTSNGGQPVENYEPYNAAAADVDEQAAASAAAAAAAKTAQTTTEDNTDLAARERRIQANQQYLERGYQEGVRRYDQGATLDRDKYNEGVREADRSYDLNKLDTRTKMQIGLREIALKEHQAGASDLRARETNVMDYLGAISKLRLPYPELQALSQRAVAGIVPGAAAPGGVGTGAGGSGGAGGAAGTGALTADQWAALATGTQRDWEQRQIGQGSGLAG